MQHCRHFVVSVRIEFEFRLFAFRSATSLPSGHLSAASTVELNRFTLVFVLLYSSLQTGWSSIGIIIHCSQWNGGRIDHQRPACSLSIDAAECPIRFETYVYVYAINLKEKIRKVLLQLLGIPRMTEEATQHNNLNYCSASGVRQQLSFVRLGSLIEIFLMLIDFRGIRNARKLWAARVAIDAKTKKADRKGRKRGECVTIIIFHFSVASLDGRRLVTAADSIEENSIYK